MTMILEIMIVCFAVVLGSVSAFMEKGEYEYNGDAEI